MKTCNKCGIAKPFEAFHKRIYKNGTVSRQTTCKECKKSISKQRYQSKQDHIKKVNADWRADNPEQMDKLRKGYLKKYPWYSAYNRSCHRARKLNALPEWADRDKLKVVYANCPDGYEVDHIIPLTGKNVAGLHVHNNLQYLTKSENKKKANKH